MRVTEVRFQMIDDNSDSTERLQAFCSITLDDTFVVRDIKVILSLRRLFVAMPSRKLTDRCHFCRVKNHLRARFCNTCGGRLDENRAIRDVNGQAKLHADVAHPIDSPTRLMIEDAVLAAYSLEVSKQALGQRVPA